ncbi:MAG: hypothetical protein P4M00_06075 [Azospirillaceae bacterium]|nr:hypothetical protein [Azospirillaceae bacterium]
MALSFGVVMLCAAGRVAGAAAPDTPLPAGPVTTCKVIVGARQRPGDDVTYRPGVDVQGDPVAPADLADSVVVGVPPVPPTGAPPAPAFDPAHAANALAGQVAQQAAIACAQALQR